MPDTEIEARVIAELDTLGADYTTLACDPDLADTAAFCAAYGVDPGDSANCILVSSRRPEGVEALCVVLATDRLDVNRAVRHHLGVRKISFADPEATVTATGQIIGGVTPFGTPPDLPILVDRAVMERPSVIVGGGSRAMKVRVVPSVFERMERVTIGDFSQNLGTDKS